jgi:hypothetical protein
VTVGQRRLPEQLDLAGDAPVDLLDRPRRGGPTKVKITMRARMMTLTNAARLRTKRDMASCQSDRPRTGATGPTSGAASVSEGAVPMRLSASINR